MNESTTPATTIHRRALASNAVFSAVSGAIAVAAPTAVAALLGDVPPVAVTIVGVSLLGFAGLVGYVAASRWRQPRVVSLISAADFSWVVTTVVLLAGWSGLFTTGGIILLLAIALIVGVFGSLQLLGSIATRPALA